VDKNSIDFYEKIDRENIYSIQNSAENHGSYKSVLAFISEYDLKNKKVLEVGSSKGLFQDHVNNYVGLDVAESLRSYYHKPYCIINDDGTYPFDDNVFDAVWSWAVFEHVVDIDLALKELVRVVRPGGVILFAPAWQCRSWAADGYPVRPYSDFGIKGKIIKFSIPVRNSVLWRLFKLIPKRVFWHIWFIMGGRVKKLHYKKLKPNYQKFWMSDSDAVNSMDPHDAILWFESNGCSCLSHPLNLKAFFVRSGGIVFRKNAA